MGRVEGGRVEGKVVLVTGGARGQGRRHAVRLAEEGADIILFDICGDIEHNAYPLSTEQDLEDACREVEKSGHRVVSAAVDVRDRGALEAALTTAVGELGRLDVVVANAGICPLGSDQPIGAFANAFDVDFIGVVNTVHVALQYLSAGASIITVGSVAGLLAEKAGPGGGMGPQGAGGSGYNLAKQFIDRYTMALAGQLAPLSIRANVVHPTNVNTPMLHNEAMYKMFRPDLEHPGLDDAILTFPMMQGMPIPFVEPEDMSHAVTYLASDESRYVTGVQLKVDAGASLKF
jgi:SDR family mycofactocin-dependent oxidoreductase